MGIPEGNNDCWSPPMSISAERDVTCSQHSSNQGNSLGLQIPKGPSRSVELATEYLASVVEEDMPLKNGKTALYWHLIAVIQQHTN